MTCVWSSISTGHSATVRGAVAVAARHGAQDVVQQRNTEQRLQHCNDQPALWRPVTF